MTIDELARRTGTTTRNIRALQTKGLLRSPALAGRTGNYDDDHLERLRAVLSLQERGFGLAGIRELFAAWEEGATLADVIGLATPAGDGRGDPADSFDDLVASVGVLARTAPFGLVPGPFAAELSMTN